MLEAADFKGYYAIIPTPATPGAGRWDAVGTVDVDEMSRLVEALLADGAAGILALGTTGECATLTQAEYVVVVDCLVETAAHRVPLFVGATALGTHEVVERLRIATVRGVTGTLLGLPMWQPLSTAMAVRFYADVAEAFPDLDVMVYANARAFRYAFPVEFWEGVAREASTVVAAKVSKADGLAAGIEATGGRVHFLPSEMRVAQFHAIAPESTTACWATSASMGPQPVRRVVEAVTAGDPAEIGRRADDIAWAHEPIEPILADPEVFASYNIQVEKARMDEAGYCQPGPVRPPYADIPEQYEAAARECGRRWRQLCER